MEQIQKYKVYVDDVFDLYNTDRRYCAGEFCSYEDAENCCKKIIDDFIEAYGTDRDALSNAYYFHGESPFVMPSNSEKPFYASAYYEEVSKRHFIK